MKGLDKWKDRAYSIFIGWPVVIMCIIALAIYDITKSIRRKLWR
jgi:hypothetical protein